MTPFDLFVWALTIAIALVVIGVGVGLAVAVGVVFINGARSSAPSKSTRQEAE